MIINAGNQPRDWNIMFKRPGEEEMEVDHLFDSSGSEVFDPTEAIEVDANGEMFEVEAGDEFRFIVMAD